MILAVAGAILLVLALALYASRRLIAREALVGWLQSRGIASEAEVQAFGFGGFIGRVRVGAAAAPDFAAARADVTYGLKGPWSGDPLGVQVTSVKLRQPVVRARLHAGKLTVGSLDPLIREFLKTPPKPNAKKPRVEIEDGLLILATDYGPLRLRANALVTDGKLTALEVTSAPTQLAGPGVKASLGPGALHVRRDRDRLDITLDATIPQADAAGFAAQAARLRVTAQAPYPDVDRHRGDGPVALHANLTGQRLSLGPHGLQGAQLAMGFQGRAAGWLSDLTVAGQGVADVRAAEGGLGPAKARALRAAATTDDLRWTRKGGDAVAASLKVTTTLDDLAVADLRLRTVSAALQGPVAAGPKGASLSLAGSATGRGAWTALGAPTARDSADIAAVKRALRDFRLAAPGVAVTADRGGARVALREPLRLLPSAGGEIRVSARGGAPLIGPDGGALRLTASGGGLPKIEADVERLSLVPSGATAAGRIKAVLSIGPVVDGLFDAHGELRIARGAVSFAGDRCAEVQAARLELGANDVEHLSASLCPAGAPLLTLAHGDWRIHGRAQGLAAQVPFLQARITEGTGLVDLGQRRGGLDARLVVAAARVEDTAPAMRFHALRMAGEADLAGDLWRADLTFRDPAGVQVGEARLRHDVRTGEGRVDLSTGVLTFAEGGLQPAPLSPIGAAIGSPATGSARFTGAFAWTKAGVTSGGTLSIPRLDFQSPAGRVTGLSGDVAFTSLAPLIAAPGQVLRAEGVAAFAPLTGVSATFALEQKVLKISGGEADVGGGKVRLEKLDVPLDPAQPARGVLAVEGVQLASLVKASPFGDRVSLDAKVSGRIPFEAQGQKVRILGGDLHAIAPGRLSISRAALSQVAASGAVSAPAAAPVPEATTDTFTDFAYQAMENLAFNKLDATINSRPDGRMGVLFHIDGRHDPPQPQSIRMSLADLIGRKFMNRKLPLPSGTGVNLTLDTTLNLDDLMRDFADYQKLRSSPPVQP